LSFSYYLFDVDVMMCIIYYNYCKLNLICKLDIDDWCLKINNIENMVLGKDFGILLRSLSPSGIGLWLQIIVHYWFNLNWLWRLYYSPLVYCRCYILFEKLIKFLLNDSCKNPRHNNTIYMKIPSFGSKNFLLWSR